MAEPFTADDVRRYGALLHEAAHGANEGVGCYPASCRQFDRYVEVLLTGLAQDGRLLPAGTDTRVEYGSRILRDGKVITESPTSLEMARDRVALHAEHRASEPGWRGEARVIRRTHHITPWAETDPNPEGNPA